MPPLSGAAPAGVPTSSAIPTSVRPTRPRLVAPGRVAPDDPRPERDPHRRDEHEHHDRGRGQGGQGLELEPAGRRERDAGGGRQGELSGVDRGGRSSPAGTAMPRAAARLRAGGRRAATRGSTPPRRRASPAPRPTRSRTRPPAEPPRCGRRSHRLGSVSPAAGARGPPRVGSRGGARRRDPDSEWRQPTARSRRPPADRTDPWRPLRVGDRDSPSGLALESPLAGRRALVTGAAGGIGAATVRRLIDAGATVVGLDAAPPEADAVSGGIWSRRT